MIQQHFNFSSFWFDLDFPLHNCLIWLKLSSVGNKSRNFSTFRVQARAQISIVSSFYCVWVHLQAFRLVLYPLVTIGGNWLRCENQDEGFEKWCGVKQSGGLTSSAAQIEICIPPCYTPLGQSTLIDLIKLPFQVVRETNVMNSVMERRFTPLEKVKTHISKDSKWHLDI